MIDSKNDFGHGEDCGIRLQSVSSKAHLNIASVDETHSFCVLRFILNYLLAHTHMQLSVLLRLGEDGCVKEETEDGRNADCRGRCSADLLYHSDAPDSHATTVLSHTYVRMHVHPSLFNTHNSASDAETSPLLERHLFRPLPTPIIAE